MKALFPSLESAWRKLAYANQGALRAAVPILLPLSWIYGRLGRIRREGYRRGILPQASFPIPIFSVGNLTVGGVGKTPFTLFLAHRLQRLGRRPAILLRGYGRRSDRPALVHRDSLHKNSIRNSVQIYGDEPSLLAFLSDYPIAVSRRRIDGVKLLRAESQCDVILLDDGFQHLPLKRDRDIVLCDGKNPFGNGRCLPCGPLREPQRALYAAHAIVANEKPDHDALDSLNRFHLPVFIGGLQWLGFYPLSDWMKQQFDAPMPLNAFQRQSLVLVSGIGSPERLHCQALSYGLSIHSRIQYPDHHWYTSEDLRQLTLHSRRRPILMTEKDAIRLLHHSEIPQDLQANAFVIRAAWQMKNQDSFDQWLQNQASFIEFPSDPVESSPLSR
ncbi:MAG: tetraacyldisaccharide 4'-kinase [Candidatus Omnitrophica bacterium]|nr:tetraacyldisaccharide 4'-kinase [Candidatus Omnitrophota bacterium]